MYAYREHKTRFPHNDSILYSTDVFTPYNLILEGIV